MSAPGRQGARAACLVAGDDTALRTALCEGLERAGHPVSVVPTARTRAEAEDHVAQARDRHGAVGGLVTCPPELAAASLDELGPATFDSALDAAYKSPFRHTQAALADLRAHGAGRLVYVTSAAGILGRAHTAHLAAGARAVIALMRTAALEEAPAITANAVAVGPAAGDPLLAARARALVGGAHADPAGAEAAVAAQLPLGRLVEPGDVVQAVLWALRPESAFLTGQTIAVAAGGELQVWP